MSDTTAVVTGASSGIDAAAACTLGRAGATVVVCARDGDVFRLVVNGIERDGGSVSVVRADVRDELGMERLMEATARADGRINVLVVNAAVAHGTPGEMPVLEDSHAAPDDTLRTNVHGVFAAVEEVLPHMADDGRILVPSSSIARETKPGMGAYAVSKTTVEAFVRQFAVDCDRTVTVVDPGFITTGLTDGQSRDPDDVTDLLVWVVTDADPAEFDGDIADFKAWKRVTR